MGSIAIDSSPWASTPLLESRGLSQAAGCRIFLKLETLQPSGSFKSRGIGNFIVCRLEELKAKNITTPPHFYCPSGGNAGLACVVAAVSLGYKATIVVPLTCSSIMIDKLRKAGATDVVVHGKTLAEATDYLQEKILPMDPTGIQVPPFDHPDVWAGNGTVIDELPAQLGEQPDAVICSVGGGGLLCGIIEGLDRLGWHDTEVVAVETKGADSLSLSLKQGELITMSAMTSSATSLGCVKVAKKCFEDGQRHNVRSVVLEDIEAEMGCVRLADEERIIVELACGVNIAMCYDGRLAKTLKSKKFTEETKVVIILCGGSNVTSDMLSGWRRDLQIRTWSSSPDFKLETAWGSETITISDVESATKAESIADEKTTVTA